MFSLLNMQIMMIMIVIRFGLDMYTIKNKNKRRKHNVLMSP